MRIAIPRERKNGETRVALQPTQVKHFIREGHEVFVETNAGALSYYPDTEYERAGATIIGDLKTLWQNAELLLKVKEPAVEEYSYFREDLIVFSFLHPAAFPEMTKALLKAKTTAYSYDLLTTADSTLPILHPMSTIAGTLSVYVGAASLLSSTGARGSLLSEVCGIPAGRVLIIGAGSAGSAAAKVAVGLGAHTTIIDINEQRLTQVRQMLPNVSTGQSSALDQALPHADLVISAILVPGAHAPKLFTEEKLQLFKPGSVFVDISIDQGGTAVTSRPSSIAEPTYIEERIVHYCVPNMPALAAQTATKALTEATFPYVCKMAKLSLQEKLSDTELASALLCKNGELTHPVVKKALQDYL